MATDPERAKESSSDIESGEEEEAQPRITNLVINNPVIHAYEGPNIPDYLFLPKSVQRRIKALKQLQLKTTNIEAKFYEEVHALECRYYQLCAPLYAQRSEIVSGLVEPTDEQCEWETDEEDEEDEGITNDLKSKVQIEVKDDEEVTKEEQDENVKGIPDFWLTIFKNVTMLADMMQEHDEPILKHLYDIQIIFLEKDPMGFVLEFHFSPNEYFSNSVLTKEYHMKCAPEKDDPFSFEGPEIYKSKGCVIDWKKGKNVTVKTIKKNQKHKSRGSTRTVTKTVANDSFFNFFTSPVVPEDSEAEMDEETQALWTTDFEIGHYIRERIVPRAVLYFTGEGLEDDDYDEDDDEDEGPDFDDEMIEDLDCVSPRCVEVGQTRPNVAQQCKQQ